MSRLIKEEDMYRWRTEKDMSRLRKEWEMV
jgi:hypothetical protein